MVYFHRKVQAIKLYERVGREVLHAAGLWEKLADCYVQMDNLPGAVNVYVRVANGMLCSGLLIHTRCPSILPRRTTKKGSCSIE